MHKVITTDEEIDLVLEQAQGISEELRAVSVEYKPGRELAAWCEAHALMTLLA